MKRTVLVAISLLICVGLLSGDVFAQASGVADMDTFIDVNFPNDSSNNVLFLGVGTSGLCSADNNEQITYLKWELADALGKTVNSASMTLYLRVNNASGTLSLSLYRVPDDGWDESTLTYNFPTVGGPARGALIQTIDVAGGYTGIVGFGANYPGDSDLAAYIRDELDGGAAPYNNAIASFALLVTGCPGNNAGVTLEFHTENGANPPTLSLQDPTAVTLMNFDSADPAAATWPFYAGLGALALVAVAGVTLSRRRAMR